MTERDLTSTTKQYYEDLVGEIGEQYATHRWKDHPIKRSHYRHTGRAIETAFRARVGRVESALEVGCGPGIWTDLVLAAARTVTLFDISEEMLKVARHKYRSVPAVKSYVQGDFIVDSTKLREKYDLIFSSRALEYMSDKGKMVRACHDLLSPGGHLVIITKNPAWGDKRSNRNVDNDGIQTDWISWGDLSTHFRDAGFSAVEAFPVAQGSYYAPYNTWLGVLACDVLARLRIGKPMRSAFDRLSESYLVVGSRR